MAIYQNRPGPAKRTEDFIERLKRFYRTPKGSIEPPFGPQKGSIEPLREGLQNHGQGSIEPFASNPPFLGCPFKSLPTKVAPSTLKNTFFFFSSQLGVAQNPAFFAGCVSRRVGAFPNLDFPDSVRRNYLKNLLRQKIALKHIFFYEVTSCFLRLFLASRNNLQKSPK